MEQFARFLPNRPIGEDLYDGQSQDRIADAIKAHILAVDAVEDNSTTLPRIIGIEGKWGSGKSNTLLQLKEKLGKGYYFFTYDAWGNQEDLQRRSLLQLLTTKLIKDDKLIGETHIKRISSALDVKPQDIDCSWQDRVDNLTSRKSSTHNITVPTIYESTKYFALMIVVTGILVPLLNAIKTSSMPCWYTYLAIVVALLPFLGYCAMMGKKIKERKCAKKPEDKEKLRGWSWKEMWQMYQTTGRTDTSTYTVSDLEPTVSEFREWMTDLSNALDGDLRLVIVFDNMDRLTREKVRQLWSSIQTFFADKGYPRVWCIIPFDRVHLANAFCDAEDKEKLTDYYIEKTFPVVYRIPDPIITDYKLVFDRLFERAFGERDEQELINRSYRLKNPKPNIREIISFINKLVSLTNQWAEGLKLSSMALYLLNQDMILEDPENCIVKRDYLKGLEKLYAESDELDTEISALAYGISTDDARQLPMKNLINQALNSGKGDFADYAKRSIHFYGILKEVVSGMDAVLTNNAINLVGVLDEDALNKNDKENLKAVWRKLTELYIENDEKETIFRKELKTLMQNSTSKKAIGNHFLKLFTNSENPHKGAEWYRVYRDVAVYTKELGVSLELPEKQMENIDFVEYLREAKEDYKNYPIKCNNKELNTFCIGQITNSLDVEDILKLTDGDNLYDYEELKAAARDLIEKQEVLSGNFEPVMKALKFLSKGPMCLDIDGDYFAGLQYEGELHPDYRVMLMLAGKEVSGLEEKDYEAMARVVFEYEPMKTIWKQCQTMNTTVYGQMSRYLIEHGIHDEMVTDTKDVISEMAAVVTKTGVERKTVIKYLSDWGRRGLTSEETALDFASVMAQEAWIDALVSDKNEFAKAILNKFYKDCGSKALSLFVNASNVWMGTHYWSKVLKRVALDEDYWKTAPGNAAEIVNHLIEGICSGNIIENTMDESLLSSLLKHVKFADVSTKVNEMMDKFRSAYAISLYKFTRLHDYFERTKNHEEVFLNKILKPIINQEAVQAIILGNLKVYEPLLKGNIEQASELKTELIKLYGNTQNDCLRALIGRLNIIVKPENEKSDMQTEK